MSDNERKQFQPGEYGFDSSGNMKVPRDQEPVYGAQEDEDNKNQSEDKKM